MRFKFLHIFHYINKEQRGIYISAKHNNYNKIDIQL